MDVPARARASITAILTAAVLAGCGSSSTPAPSQSAPPSAAPSASAAPSVAAPSPSAAPSVAAPSPTTYVVRKGDTLYGIAVKFHVTLTALRKANPKVTDPRMLRPGTKLVIPAP